MTAKYSSTMSRRGFCLCCVGGAAFTATGAWLTPRAAFAEARGLVSLIKDSAAVSPIVTHKLRNNISVLEGSGETSRSSPDRTARCSSMPASASRDLK